MIYYRAVIMAIVSQCLILPDIEAKPLTKILLLFKIQTYLCAKGKNEPSEAVVGADSVK